MVAISNNSELLNLLPTIANTYDKFCIVGDFNLPNINWHLLTCESISNTHFSFKFLECLRDCFINQIVDSPTRIRIGYVPNILHLVLSNIDDDISNVNAGPAIGMSDHGTITFHINLHPITDEGKFMRYMYDKGNYKEMNKYVTVAINIYKKNIYIYKR